MNAGFKILSRESGNPPSILNFYPEMVHVNIGVVGKVMNH